MNDQERAEQHLRTIRRLMERATIYRAISAPTALAGGLLSIAACAFWISVTHAGSQTAHGFLQLWLIVLFLTVAANTLFIVLGAKKRNEPVFSPSMKAAFVALAPAFIVAAVLTSLFLGRSSAPLNELTLCIMWILGYGIGLLATSHFAPRSLTILGYAFMVVGIAAVLIARFGGNSVIGALDIRSAAYFMAGTFGLFHLIYAACTWPRKGVPPET